MAFNVDDISDDDILTRCSSAFEQLHHPIQVDPSLERFVLSNNKEIPVKRFREKVQKHKQFLEPAREILIENGLIIHWEKTLVAFFDIQGYSFWLEEHGASCIPGLEAFLNSLLTELSLSMYNTDIIKTWLLSDSIIVSINTLATKGLGPASLSWFFQMCSYALATSLQNHRIPLRGAIGGGDFYSNGNVIASTALVNAAKYENKQNWLGAVITPEAETLITQGLKAYAEREGEEPLSLTDAKFIDYVSFGKIPWKDDISNDLPSKAYYIAPNPSFPDWKDCLPDYFNDQEKTHNSEFLYKFRKPRDLTNPHSNHT